MTLWHMKIFLALCEHDYNTTRAAEALHMTQPAVSLALRELEAHYGVVLFDRIGHHRGRGALRPHWSTRSSAAWALRCCPTAWCPPLWSAGWCPPLLWRGWSSTGNSGSSITGTNF